MSEFDLQRFETAQAPVIRTVLEELRAGRKRTHWIWFVFPQIRGLGMSPTSQHYGIVSLAEAKVYAAHPVLGERLIQCTRAVLAHRQKTLLEVFGSPDDLKFTSSMTLFKHTSRDTAFAEALETFCGGVEDPRTLELLL